MRIRPYIKDGNKKSSKRSKYKIPEDMPTKDEKLEVKNANRSLKKAYRAELKRELENEIKNLKNNGRI